MNNTNTFKLSIDPINENENISSLTNEVASAPKEKEISMMQHTGPRSGDGKTTHNENGNSKTSNLSTSSGSSCNSDSPEKNMPCVSDNNTVSFSDVDTIRMNLDSDRDEESPADILDEMEKGGLSERPRIPAELSKTYSQRARLWNSTRRMSRRTLDAGRVLCRGAYAKKEGMFVCATAAVLSFNCGFANGTTMSGLLTPSGDSVLVSGFAGSYTKSALHLAEGEIPSFGFYTNLILSYMFGNLCVGIIAPDPVPWNMQPAYGPLLLLGGLFELTAALLAHFQYTDRYIFFFACAATGVQNGIASSYSANLLRCATTGASTDLALVVGRIIRGNRKDVWRAYVLFSVCLFFWLGGLTSFYAAKQFKKETLFVNAGLFWVMGAGLVIFLIRELDVSLKDALLGTWKWKETMDKLVKSKFGENFSEDEFRGMFNEIDTDRSGEITADELLEYLEKGDVGVTGKEVRALMKFADSNGDGKIDREEWAEICDKFMENLKKSEKKNAGKN